MRTLVILLILLAGACDSEHPQDPQPVDLYLQVESVCDLYKQCTPGMYLEPSQEGPCAVQYYNRYATTINRASDPPACMAAIQDLLSCMEEMTCSEHDEYLDNFSGTDLCVPETYVYNEQCWQFRALRH